MPCSRAVIRASVVELMVSLSHDPGQLGAARPARAGEEAREEAGDNTTE